MDRKSSAVENMVSVAINDNEYAALVCFAYNVGVGALHGSTLLKMLNANQDRVAVADQFLRWNKAGGIELPGLTRRRQAERSLFLHPMDNSAADGDTEVQL
jgi:lysozyme